LDDGSIEQTIPVILVQDLGVDAMAIELYLEKANRILLLKQVGVNLDSASPRILKEQAKISSYCFVYYTMPLDPTLPQLIVSVIPHKN
jgi:hypothetical protein